ncbi:MAG: ABC transporter ATP-binding protein/permease [Oscillospiraceae bacterium]|nr:ABC transporter ATP-binding protein/permease [Oscillospiraceae bacterium]
MLELKNITKEYPVGDATVHALRGVSVQFRDNEFVAVLGHSGCGKTTLLNIIGGLDRYTQGDLLINGVSTKEYRDRNWDSYRNHSVGFVFQTYNLIPHQSVLSNVELALTLSGVSKKERRTRATEVLKQVGLGDQLHKRPNQMSGGQMQRVAIARALVNNPTILLADEPTGALDSETSVQVMEILKEIAKDRLVIMVTHNPDLAAAYSTRIVRLHDGAVVGDTMPYTASAQELSEAKRAFDREKNTKKTSMSFLTALSLSFNNLMTKKARTILISFAGSIGIIGIALILSMSSGARQLITRMERDTLSAYPITLEKTTMDISAMMGVMDDSRNEADIPRDDSHIYSVNVMRSLIETMIEGARTNNLASFKAYLESGESGIEQYTSEVRYSYSTPLNIYRTDTPFGTLQVNPNQVSAIFGRDTQQASESPMRAFSFGSSSNTDVWSQLSDDETLIASQYEVLAGRTPQNDYEVVLIVDEENRIRDFALYSLGLLDPAELEQALEAAALGEEVSLDTDTQAYAFDEILGTEFKLLTNTDYFLKENGIWVDKSEDEAHLLSVLSGSDTITVVGILRPSKDAVTAAPSGLIGYRSGLMEQLIGKVNASEIVAEQLAQPDTDIFTGLSFEAQELKDSYSMDELNAYAMALPQEQQAVLLGYVQTMQASGMDDTTIATQLMTAALSQATTATYTGNLDRMGVADLDDPETISLYPIDFESKDSIAAIIDTYNQTLPESAKLVYTDYIGIIIDSLTTIINAISYILIGFVAVSLVVSSIMIGIITYISVLERTREIGVLRSIGASKKDISRVFNAETLTIGLAAGIFGIGITSVLIIPINAIIKHLSDLSNVAVLPVDAAVILIGISMVLTFIAGLIPSRIAAKKDPVIALRSE